MMEYKGKNDFLRAGPLITISGQFIILIGYLTVGDRWQYANIDIIYLAFIGGLTGVGLTILGITIAVIGALRAD